MADLAATVGTREEATEPYKTRWLRPILAVDALDFEDKERLATRRSGADGRI